MSVERRLLVRQCNEIVTADSVKPHAVHLYFVKRSMSGSAAVFPQFEKSIVSAI